MASTSRSRNSMSDPLTHRAGRFTDVIGRDHLDAWSDAEVGAWTGLMLTVDSQRRAYAAELERTLGLSPSAAGILGRLDGAREGRMRLSTLACSSDLSLSRVSRIIDALELRGLVVKRQCSGDGRATNAHITETGRTTARDAQDCLSRWLREHFFGPLSTDEVEALAGAFGRLAAAPAQAAALPSERISP